MPCSASACCCVRSAALVLAAVALPAIEVVVNDVRLGVLALPAAFSAEVTSPTVTATVDDSFRSGTGFELGWRRSFAPTGSPLGALVGADLVGASFTYDGGDGMGIWALRACGGAVWAPFDDWQFAVEAGAWYGRADLTLPATSGAPAYEADGDTLAVDARVSASWRFAERWSLHAHLGWLRAASDLSGDRADINLTQSGMMAGLGLTWFLSTAPTRLE